MNEPKQITPAPATPMLPCPYCGDKFEIDKSDPHLFKIILGDAHSNCPIDENIEFSSEDQLIEYMNKRAAPPASSAAPRSITPETLAEIRHAYTEYGICLETWEAVQPWFQDLLCTAEASLAASPAATVAPAQLKCKNCNGRGKLLVDEYESHGCPCCDSTGVDPVQPAPSLPLAELEAAQMTQRCIAIADIADEKIHRAAKTVEAFMDEVRGRDSALVRLNEDVIYDAIDYIYNYAIVRDERNALGKKLRAQAERVRVLTEGMNRARITFEDIALGEKGAETDAELAVKAIARIQSLVGGAGKKEPT